jgi:hypothetical protein
MSHEGLNGNGVGGHFHPLFSLFYSVRTENLFLHLELIFILFFSVFANLMQHLDYPD